MRWDGIQDTCGGFHACHELAQLPWCYRGELRQRLGGEGGGADEVKGLQAVGA